eukprot:6287233-Karenia_brevis.AAC.1
MRILRVCLSIYGGPRVLSVEGAVTETFCLSTSIVAGCTFATTLLRVVLIEILDAGCRLYPQIELYVYIDDIDLGVSGTAEAVVETCASATRMMVLGLENKLGAS